MSTMAWKRTAGPLLRYDTVDEQGTYHAFVLVITEHPKQADAVTPPMLVYAAQATAPGMTPQTVGNAMQSQGVRLWVYDDKEHDASQYFWRFKIEVTMRDSAQMVTYRVTDVTEPFSFHIPARNENFRWATHSCNGFSSGTPEEEWGGRDPLWRDMLNEHEKAPFHMVMGGGDQIYNDKVAQEPELSEWSSSQDPAEKMKMQVTPEILHGIDRYLFWHYSEWFGGGDCGKAIAQIPMVNMLDDHDLIDGFGTYPDDLMQAPIFNTIGSRGYFFYLLFQQFINNDVDGIRNEAMETNQRTAFRSVIIGGPGAYIPYPTCNLLVYLGPKVYTLLLDCRAQRKIDQVCAQDTYRKCFDAVRQMPPSVEQLVIQLGVPLAYPRMVMLERILSSRFNPLVLIAKRVLPKFTNNFNGQVELLDDLNDHWCALHHKRERNWLIEQTQNIALTKKLRVSFVSGDVHAGGCSVFSSHGNTRPEKDPKYSLALITSAIVNAPPPMAVITMVNRLARHNHRSLAYRRTKEQMIPLFRYDFEGKKQHNKYIVGARNWCSVRYDTMTSELVFDLRVEHPKGSGQVQVYTVRAPPPRFEKKQKD